MQNNFRLFGLSATRDYARQVAEHLDIELSPHVEKYFADREPYIRSDVNVRGCDVYVIQSLYTNKEETVLEKFAKLLYFIGSLRDASAHRITAVIPYCGFLRQDRKTESRAPVTTKYMAMLLETMGLNRLLTMDVHNLSAIQCAFRIPIDILEAKNLIARYVADQLEAEEADNLSILVSDTGAAGRSKRFLKTLAKLTGRKIGLAYMDKSHEGDVIKGEGVTGDIEGKNMIVIDDMISTAKTVAECQRAIEENGGKLWAACATHALCVGEVNQNLANVRRLIVTDTIASGRLSEENLAKVHVIPTTRLFAQAIGRIHNEGGSISDLLKG